MNQIDVLDIVGKTYNALSVCGYSHALPRPKGNRKHFYSCKCVCGNSTVAERWRIVSGNTKSCGCINSIRKDLTGKRFGKLLLIKKLKEKRGKSRATRYLCLCDCGRQKEISINPLSTGRVKSCGCWNIEYHSQFTGDKNVWWRGGGKSDYPPQWNFQLRESVRNRDGRMCQFPDCAYDDTKNSRRLNVHHINGNKHNCRENNLISLCSKHHAFIEKTNPSAWENWFYQVTSSYE